MVWLSGRREIHFTGGGHLTNTKTIVYTDAAGPPGVQEVLLQRAAELVAVRGAVAPPAFATVAMR